MSERYLVLHLPAFRLERCGFEACEVAVLVDEVKGATRLVATTPAAAQEGLHVGITVADARARCPEVLVDRFDPDGEALDRAELASLLGRLSDRVRVLSPIDLCLEIGATAHLFGGEEALALVARQQLEDIGHRVHLVVAEDPTAARALATLGRDQHVPHGQIEAALAPLPVTALFPSTALLQSLVALGIETVAQYARLDPASLSGRFGEEGLQLHRIARGLPATHAPPTWASDVSPIHADVVLGGPTVTLSPIHFVLPGLLHRIASALERRDEVAVKLVLRLVLESGRTRRISVSVGRPTRSVALLERVTRLRLENLRLDAPVVELAIEVEESTPDTGWQPGLVDRTENAEELPDLLARLSDALGNEALFAAESVATWRPEHAWKPVPYAPGALRRRAVRRAKIDPVDAVVRYDQALPRPRPTRLLEAAEPLSVRATPPDPEGGQRPLAIQDRQGWESVLERIGPEHLQSGWWDPDAAFSRTYWTVRTRTGTSWIFHDGTRWWRHGWFD